MSATLQQVALVARRSAQRTMRQPILIAPTLLFPLMMLAVNANGLDQAKRIPGFPADSYLDFAIVVPFMQGALFAAVTAGTALATDIESGFLDRLALTPLGRVALLAGQLAGALALSLLGALVYLVAGVAAGADLASGAPGAVALVAYALVTALAFAGVGAFLGARTGSAQAVQGVFPLMFVLFFLSSMSLPRPLIEIDWFRTVATLNPVSYVIEGLRSLVIVGWDATALLRGLAVLAVAIVGSFALASRALATRMERT